MSRFATPPRITREVFDRDIRWRINEFYEAWEDVQANRVDPNIWYWPRWNALVNVMRANGLNESHIPPVATWHAMCAHNGWTLFNGDLHTGHLINLVNDAIRCVTASRSRDQGNIPWTMADSIALDNNQWRASLGPGFVEVPWSEIPNRITGNRRNVDARSQDALKLVQEICINYIYVRRIAGGFWHYWSERKKRYRHRTGTRIGVSVEYYWEDRDVWIEGDYVWSSALPREIGSIGARESVNDGQYVNVSGRAGERIKPFDIDRAQWDIRNAIWAALNSFANVGEAVGASHFNYSDNPDKRKAALDGNADASHLSLFSACNKMIVAAREATKGYAPYDLRICHGNCHSNCHGSRGRR